MTLATLQRRLNNLKGTGMNMAAMINQALAGGRERSLAWRRAGNTGPMPFRPLPELSNDSTRAEREMHETLTMARLRVERGRAQTGAAA